MRLSLSAASEHARGCAATLIALTLVLRIAAAPFVMASPAPDVMAICSGGKIIYISLIDGQPVEGDDHPVSEACPFFGIVSALLASTPSHVMPSALVVVPHQIGSAATPYLRDTYRDNQSRAPPVLV